MDVSYIVLIRILCIRDPENIEVVNFILEESIPRLENHQNKKINNGKKSSFWLDVR